MRSRLTSVVDTRGKFQFGAGTENTMGQPLRDKTVRGIEGLSILELPRCSRPLGHSQDSPTAKYPKERV